jgi:RHS repeat-associated protein
MARRSTGHGPDQLRRVAAIPATIVGETMRRGVLAALGRGKLSAPLALLSALTYVFALAPRAYAAEGHAATAVASPRTTAAGVSAAPKGSANPRATETPADAARGVTPLLALPTTGFGSEATNQGLSLPQAPATVHGMGESFNVSLSTGGATLAVPISIPTARGAAQPMLSLAYDSSAGRGVAGLGWDFGQVFISRQIARGIPGYQDPPAGAGWQPGQDRFVFGSDELVPICLVAGGTCPGLAAGEAMPSWADGWQYFRPQVERSFVRYFWSPDHNTWRIQSKSGGVLELGQALVGPVSSADSNALTVDPNDPSHVFRWYLSRQFDNEDGTTPGSAVQPLNIVVYRYRIDGGASYLEDVYDTPPVASAAGSTTASYAHHVHVTYEPRSDPAFSYESGWQIRLALRLTRVDVTSQSAAAAGSRELVRRYTLAYDPQSHASLLTSIQVEGRCAQSGQQQITEDGNELLPWPTGCPTLPAMTLGYSHVTDPSGKVLAPPPGFDGFEGISTTLQTIAQSPPYSYGDDQVSPYDINGDGLPDVLVTAPGLFQRSAHGVFVNGTGGQVAFGGPQLVTMAPSTDPAVTQVTTSVLELTNPNVAPLDVDGDGMVDFLHMPVATTYTVFKPLSVGSGYQWTGRSLSVPLQQVPAVDFTHWNLDVRVMDVNGDGLVDIVHTTGTEIDTYFGLGRFPGGDGQFGQARWTGPTNAALSISPAASCVPWSATPIRFADADTYIADMNGDGLPDIVRVREGDVRYWPGRGNGFWGTGLAQGCAAGTMGEGQEIAMSGSPTDIQIGSPIRLDDVNGDGLTDIVRSLYGAVEIWLNIDGTSWTPQPDVITGPYSSQIIDQVRLLDINGSGTKDVVWGAAGAYKYIDLQNGQRPWLLTSVQNGLGKSTQIGYRSSVQLMLDAAAQHAPWQSVMPLALPVVTTVVESDNLSNGGGLLGIGSYETDYLYADPLYDGQRREFLGFRTTTVRHVGDATQPSAIETTVSLQGQCVTNTSDGYDVCAPSERWRDNPRDVLKGLPLTSSVQDAAGVTFSTTHHGYTMEGLYAGADGRTVERVFENARDVWSFETSPFTAGNASVSVVDLTDRMHGGETSASTLALASSAFGHLQSTSSVDVFGNVVSESDSGCVDGTACTTADEVITTTTVPGRSAADVTGWTWRLVEQYVTGSSNASDLEHHTHADYDGAGHLIDTQAELVGSLALSRSNPSGGGVAPPPASASTDGRITTSMRLYDPYGNLVLLMHPGGRCTTLMFDSQFANMPVTETVFGGAVQGPCGTTALATKATYDRGLEAIVSVTGFNGEASTAVYDGFGRPVEIFRPDPRALGTVSPQPASMMEYLLPGASPDPAYSVIHAKSANGTDPSVAAYHESWTFIDGMGRKRLTIEQADPAAGDGGAYVAGTASTMGARGVVLRTYRPFFWNGAPLSFPLRSFVPSSEHMSQRVDALARVVEVYGLDGAPEGRTVFHPLSVDTWDSEDMLAGPHQGTPGTVKTDGHGRKIALLERLHNAGLIETREVQMTYRPAGEMVSITRVRDGSSDAPVVRWMRYDSLGRLVLNVDPNTSQNFNPNPSTDPTTINAWRYAYDDSGALVGTSDARGCGENLFYDGAGRLVAEDYSPCQGSPQAAYSAPQPNGAGMEATYLYDVPDPESSSIADADGRPLPVNAGAYLGKLASIADRGQKAVFSYDGRGRMVGMAKHLALPGPSADGPSARYAPRWYVRTIAFDAADRPLVTTTGSTVTELSGASGESTVTTVYSGRGTVSAVTSSYGPLINEIQRTAEGLSVATVFGDVAHTTRAQTYDSKLRVSNVMTYRGAPTLWSTPSGSYVPPAPGTPPTLQLVLEDLGFTYDTVGNITAIRDFRLSHEWPQGAQPVTRKIAYDDLYRVLNVQYDYPTGADPWTSPFNAELQDPTLEQPVPQVSFPQRTRSQTFSYDWLGNTTSTSDDAQGFYDRSLGSITNGTATDGPYQLRGASNRAGGGSRTGQLTAGYDASGNLTGLIVDRDGACLSVQASCSQQYAYSWDELGRLVSARRWDLVAPGVATLDALPSGSPSAEMQYAYDARDQRVLKTAIDVAGNVAYDAFIFSTLELRRATWTGSDYNLDRGTETVYLCSGDQRVAHVVYEQGIAPTVTGGQQHVFLLPGGFLGSQELVIDRDTSELVERSTYTSYGTVDSDYRPARWNSFRERYGFTDKEDDIEVGLVYFGARYYAPALGRWISADPLTTHKVGSDLNAYAYGNGRPFAGVDPNGLEIIAALILGAILGAAISGATNAAIQATSGHPWSWDSFGKSLIVGAVTGEVGAIWNGAFTAAYGAAAMSTAGAAVGGFVVGAVGGFTSAELNHESGEGIAKEVGLDAAMGLGVALVGALVHPLSQGGGGGAAAAATRSHVWQGIETIATGAAGGTASYFFLRAVGANKTLSGIGAAFGAYNGLFMGYSGAYNWSNVSGYVAFALDSTWGLGGTALGTLLHLTNIFIGSWKTFDGDLTYRQNRQVFEGGACLEHDSAFTLGNVSSNMGGADAGLLAHETAHIWQNRFFGPLFLTTYAGVGVAGAILGVPFSGGIRTMAYLDNPFEAWSYQYGGTPHGVNGDLQWWR